MPNGQTRQGLIAPSRIRFGRPHDHPFRLLAALASGAVQDAPPADAVATNTSWEQTPPPTLAYPEYPPLATILGVGGDVHLRCVAWIDGTVSDSEVLSASNPGWGFEAAAIWVVQLGRLRSQTVNGVPQAATFTVRIPFQAQDFESLGTYSGPEPGADELKWVRDLVAFNASVEQLSCLNLDYLSPEERAAVMSILNQAFEEHRRAWVEGGALAMARMMPAGTIAAVRAGGAPPVRARARRDRPCGLQSGPSGGTAQLCADARNLLRPLRMPSARSGLGDARNDKARSCDRAFHVFDWSRQGDAQAVSQSPLFTSRPNRWKVLRQLVTCAACKSISKTVEFWPFPPLSGADNSLCGGDLSHALRLT